MTIHHPLFLVCRVSVALFEANFMNFQNKIKAIEWSELFSVDVIGDLCKKRQQTTGV